MEWESNPYTLAQKGQIYIENKVEAAVAYMQAKSGGVSPQFKKYTATNLFIAETAA